MMLKMRICYPVTILLIMAVVESQADYEEVNGDSRYLITTASLNFADAEAYCVTWGGHLATINDMDEQNYLWDIYGRDVKVWIGYNDRDKEDVWVWTSGGTSSFTDWSSKQPNDWQGEVGGQDCACFSDVISPWNDMGCNNVIRFVCEADIIDCASSPCMNGGQCTDDVNGFTCTCSDGFEGEICETDKDECASSPCKNGGQCTDAVNGFTCTCAAGFEGETCETEEVMSVQAWSEGGCCVYEYVKLNLFFINHEAVPVARSRGFNMVTIDGKSGGLIAAAVFDTYGSSTAENAMAEFIEGTPEGSVVMATTFDSAEAYCKTTCKNSLKSVGAERETFEHRTSYALLGYKRKAGETVFPPWVEEKYAAYPGASGRGGLQSPALSVSANITLGF